MTPSHQSGALSRNHAASRGTAPAIRAVARALGLAAALALAASATGQECSGGPGGGADATGNQCSHPPTTPASAATAAAPAAQGFATPAPASPGVAPAPGAMTSAAHRKQMFDERRARFADGGKDRVAVAAKPGPASAP